MSWSSDHAVAEVFNAIPLTGPTFVPANQNATNQSLPNQSSVNPSGANQQLMGVLLVGSSRRPLIELQRRVVSTAMLVGGAGILVAVLASRLFAARVNRPVLSLA